MKRTPIKIVRITNSQGLTREVPSKDLLSIETKKSIMEYAGTFNILIANPNGKNTKLCEVNDEIEIWLGYEETQINKDMAGFIDSVILEKDEKSKHTIRLQGRSYYSILLDNKFSGRVDYTEGYGQVLREILKSTPLKPDGIVKTQGRGTIIFRNAPLIDIVRQLAEEMGWTFRVDNDKIFYFNPITPPKDSGITLTDKDIKSMRFVKRSR